MESATQTTIDEDQRIEMGAASAGIAIAIIFGSWRLAVTFDTGSDFMGWFWLVIEWAILLWTSFLIILPFALLGGWLESSGYDKRWQAALGGVVIALAYGWVMLLIGLVGMHESETLGIPFANYLVLLFAGALGGVFAHTIWFPSRNAVETLDAVEETKEHRDDSSDNAA